MDNLEALVHITAPSSAHDDRRYRDQAEAVARFEPFAVTALYRPSTSVNASGPDSGSCSSNSSFATSLEGWSSIVKETPAQQRSHHLLSKVGGLPTSSAPANITPAHWRITKQFKKSKHQPRPAANPPYKNPFRNSELRQSTIQAVRTPDPPRPKTAPAGDSGRSEGSLDGWVTRKRARSESSSFEGFSSIVPETQQVHRFTAAPNSSGSSTQSIPSTTSDTTHFEIPMRLSQESVGDEENRLKRRRLHESSSQTATPTKSQRVAEVHSRETQFLANTGLAKTLVQQTGLVATSAPVDGLDPPQPFFLHDRSPEWTTSSRSSLTSSENTTTPTATATPSQGLPQTSKQASNNPLSPSAYHNPSSPINLLSQDLHSTPPRQHTVLDLAPAPRSSPPGVPASPKSPISSLQKCVCPKPPPTGHGAFVTHITPSLEGLLQRTISIAKCFRPVYVSRDVGVLERGYWRLPVTIASPEAVAKARVKEDRFIKARRQREGLTATQSLAKLNSIIAERARRSALGLSSSPIEHDEEGQTIERKRCDMWTEKEFLEFWDILATGVRCGNYGWGVSIYREEWADEDETDAAPKSRTSPPLPSSGLEDATTGGHVQKEKRFLLKIYTWGEVIPHMWLLMWIISDKITSYTAMEWRAGDDSVVVRMSGYRRRHGILGDWVYKGPPGEKGIWGIVPHQDWKDTSLP